MKVIFVPEEFEEDISTICNSVGFLTFDHKGKYKFLELGV